MKKQILSAFVCCAIGYLFSAFVTMELNPVKWASVDRMFSGFVAGTVGWIMFSVTLLKPKP